MPLIQASVLNVYACLLVLVFVLAVLTLQLKVDGGVSRSELLLQIQSNLLDIEVLSFPSLSCDNSQQGSPSFRY